MFLALNVILIVCFLLCMAAVLCPEPESTPNGKYRYVTQATTPVVGSQLEYTCQSAYTLVGERVLTCLNTGEWSSNTPTCAGKWKCFSIILCSTVSTVWCETLLPYSKEILLTKCL